MAGFLFCVAVAASIHAGDEPDPAIVLSPASQGYVNTRLCFGCHAAIFKAYRETGMAKSFAQPRAENTVEDYKNNNHFYHAPSNTYFEMIRRGGDYFQLRYQIGYEGRRTNVEETKIDYFLGSAIHARAYLHRSADGRLLQLPVTWYSEKGGYWWMAPGYDSPDHLEVSVGGRVVEAIVVRIIFDGVLRPGVGERLRHAGFAIGLKDGRMAPETQSRVHVTLGHGVENDCGAGLIRCVD
jgi:hypothetical protein